MDKYGEKMGNNMFVAGGFPEMFLVLDICRF